MDAAHTHTESSPVHHQKHMRQTPIHFPQKVSYTISLRPKFQVHGGGSFLPHLVVNSDGNHVVAFQSSGIIPAFFGYNKQRNSFGAFGCAIDPGQHQVHNIVGHILISSGNEDFLPFVADDYGCITHPTTLRTFKNSLESIHQYTETGLVHIFNGEVGRYEGCRFIEQNFIPKGGALDSVTFDPWTGTADAWNNALSSWAFFFGADTVTEAVVIPEEIRAKIPGDFGRSRAIAWLN